MIKEKARRPHQKVKGTVLFTVVCVMMVLIVFLMGTLALASTANKRANYKYMKAQNETIARTVIDAVVTDIQHDTSSDGINNALAKNTSFDMEVELDGRSYPVTVSRGGKQSWYDTPTGQWLEGDIINLTATVASVGGNEPVNYNASLVMSIQSNPGNNNVNPNPAGGAFVSMGDAGVKIGTTGLTTGGTEINLGGDPTKTTIHIGHSNSTMIETPTYLNGSGVLDTTITLYVPAMNVYGQKKGNAYLGVNGDFEITNEMKFKMHNDCKWASLKDKKAGSNSDNSLEPTYYYNIPCIYVAGTCTTKAQGVVIGTDEVMVNLYCGALDTTDKGISVKGDIYCFDAGKTSYVAGQSEDSEHHKHGIKLYDWAKKTIHYEKAGEQTQSFGNFYSNGNAWFGLTSSGDRKEGKIETGGDIRVVGDLTIATMNEDVMIGKDLVCGGKVTLTNHQAKTLHCQNFYADELELNGWTIDCTGDCRIGTVIGSGTIKCANYTITNKGDASVTGNAGSVDAYGTIYPEDFTKDSIEHNIVTKPDPDTYNPAKNPSTYPTTLDDLNTLTTVKDSNGNETLVEYKVVDDGDALEFKDPADGLTKKTNVIEYSARLSGIIKKEVTVKPKVGNTIAIVIGGDAVADYNTGAKGVGLSTKGSNRGNLIIDDNCTAFIFVEKGKALVLDKGDLLTSYWKTKTAGGWNFTVERTKAADYPKVYLYGAEDSSTRVQNGCFMTANVRAPKMNFSGDKGVENTSVTYIDAVKTEMKCIGLVGQLIANKISVANEWGLAYVEPGNNNGGNNGGNNNNNNNGNNNNVSYSINGASINYTIY